MKKSSKKASKKPPEAELLRLINGYLGATREGPTAWGLAAMGDAKFVGKLEQGQRLREKTRERALDALADGWARIAQYQPAGGLGGSWADIRARL